MLSVHSETKVLDCADYDDAFDYAPYVKNTQYGENEHIAMSHRFSHSQFTQIQTGYLPCLAV